MREIYALFAILALSTHAFASDPAKRQECLSKVDAMHACACNDVRGESPVDLGAFDLNRADIRSVYDAFRQSDHYTPDQDAKLIEQLRMTYDEQREQLSCHDKVGMRASAFIMADEYCLHEEAAARQANKPLCKEVTQDQIQQSSKVVLDRIGKFMGTFDQEIERLSTCKVASLQPMKYSHTVAVVYPPCKIDLKSLFPNNVSKLTPAQVKKIVDHIQGHTCYQQYLRNGLALEKIEISSSSNLLANTGIAVNKTFLTLSEERAIEIEEKVVSTVFDRSIFTRVAYDKTFKGQNGDGTTGACPYAYDSRKKNWMRKPFPTDAQMEGFKKTELNFYFGDATHKVDSNIHNDMMTVPCKRAMFFCNK